MNVEPTKITGVTLYVHSDSTWEALWKEAIKLHEQGYTVWVHDHGPDDRCRADGARCRCGRLTQGSDGLTLDLITPLDNNI
jgi:hypothetical protein